MAAKLLHSLADENPDLRKQIGCMNGIFQIFDRQHVLSGKRITHSRLSQGGSSFGHGSLERRSNGGHFQQTSGEMRLNKSGIEKQRHSRESSRASSGCSSSASSVDFDRASSQQEVSSSDVLSIPETSTRDQVTSGGSMRLGRHSLDLRDVVKDSMYGESRGLTTGRRVNHRDSPRPLQIPNHSEEHNTSAELKESLRVLAKLRETSWYYNNDAREPSRSLYESKDAPRYSYDGREINSMSFDSRDSSKSSAKLKELPRLSLDSRESSVRGSNFGSKRISKSCRVLDEKDLGLPHLSESQKRPPSVVAKLMGLDAMPDSTIAAGADGESGLKSFPVHDGEAATRPSRPTLREPSSPRWRNPDLAMKPVSSSSRFPIEPAPWKMQDGNKGSLRTGARAAKTIPPRASDSFPSVYSEIEKRLKDLEFKQSGRDLRALKQILEAMQAKGLLETSGEEHASSFGAQGLNEQRYTKPNLSLRSENHRNGSTIRGSSSMRTYESPIVIMKPAKLVEKSGLSSSVYKPPNAGASERKKGSSKSRAAKEQSPKSISVVDKRVNSINTKSSHSSSRSQQLQTDNAATTNSLKGSGSVSPRLQQKRAEMEKRSRPPTAPSSSSKPRRQTNNKQSTDLGSPGGRSRSKYSPNSQQCDDQLSEISNESKSLSCHGDDVSVRSEDVEVTSTVRSTESHKKTMPRLGNDVALAELGGAAPDQPSPVSVLDAFAYKDDEPSPVKQITTPIIDMWKPDHNLANTAGSGISSEINRKKLANIENLVQKLRRLNSSHDEARTDYIASLCENTNPDHRYISEILLASGLLLRDLSSGLTSFQLHPSGHPINPELFFVLEQTKASKERVAFSGAEKFHRKLIFDAVNEFLAGKLSLASVSREEPWLRPEKRLLARKTLSAQKLLKELCHEIEQFRTEKQELEDDGLKAILCTDVAKRSGSWTDFSGEVYGVVLDVERSMFKDMVDEIVRGEAANLRAKSVRRRQLFGK